MVTIRPFFLTFISVFLVASVVAHAQSPYILDWKKELALSAAGGAALGLGYYLQDEITLFTPDELLTLDPKDINAFDRIATDFKSSKSHNISNYFFYGSPVLPALLMLGHDARGDAGTIGILWFETMLITGGTTSLFKHSFRRPRPFVFDETVQFNEKMTANAKASFVSGHTSGAAANSFFAATIFSEYYPESKWKPVVWGVAAAVPAVTGYLRVRAGRHYPTDVLGGYALGALIGWGVPKLHESKILKEKGVTLNGGPNGIHARVIF